MSETQVKKILRIDSSARRSNSITRQLGDEVIRRLQHVHPDAGLIVRELSEGIDFLDEQWVQANLTDPAKRDPSQQEVLAASDALVRELDAADVVLLTVPVYNFSIPAALKAWIDMICRARMTFQYTENGPQGLLKDRPVYLVMASGGVPFGSAFDFASEAAALAMLEQWLPNHVAPAIA